MGCHKALDYTVRCNSAVAILIADEGRTLLHALTVLGLRFVILAWEPYILIVTAEPVSSSAWANSALVASGTYLLTLSTRAMELVFD